MVVNPNGVSGAFASASGRSLWSSDLGRRTSDVGRLIPGSMVGLIVGFLTQRYGSAATAMR